MKQLLVILLLLLCTGCTSINNKPTLTLSDTQPYYLEIKDFQWSYGLTEFNKFNGDFEALDKQVFDLLKGKDGVCTVRIEMKQTDKYGKTSSNFVNIGNIDLTELSKFENWEYWRHDGGIQKLVYNHFIANSPPDSLKGDTSAKLTYTTQSKADTPLTVNGNNGVPTKTYTFTEKDLYPSQEDRSSINLNQSAVNGIIGDINFSNGVMQIASDEGETFTVQFYPFNASSDTQNRLRFALRSGYRIMSTCATAGASTLDLVSAKVIAK